MTRTETSLSAGWCLWTILKLPLIPIQEYNIRDLSIVDDSTTWYFGYKKLLCFKLQEVLKSERPFFFVVLAAVKSATVLILDII